MKILDDFIGYMEHLIGHMQLFILIIIATIYCKLEDL